MFDKLIDFILKQITYIIPFVIIFQFNKGVRYRFGKFKSELEPGFYLKIPYLDTVLQTQAVDTTILLPTQSIRSKDRKEIVVRATVGYKIKNMAYYYNRVYDSKSAVSDISCMLLRGMCVQNTRNNIETIEFGEALKNQLQETIEGYGITVNFFQLTECTECNSYKLFNEKIKLES